jgi:hypothetical protein
MDLSSRFVRSALPLALGALVLTGCGAILTAGIAGGVLALGGGGGGSSGGSPTRIDSAAVVGDTSGGTVTFDFTVSNGNGSPAAIQVRYSTDPNEQTPFAATATGTFTGGLANGSSLGTSAAGTSYGFSWNTSQDLGTKLFTAVRLEILVDGEVGFTTENFTVDDTVAPQIVSVTLPPLPPGATVYADQQGGGGIRIGVIVADANSSNVALTALYSTDGGNTFPATNVAAGNLVDASTGAIVPIDSATTTPSGRPYIFRFESGLSGLGTQGQQGSVEIQFTATTSKSGSARSNGTPFAVDNAAFSVVPNTPSGGAITDVVTVNYLLVDTTGGEGLNLVFAFSTSGQNGPFQPCTELHQPPSEGTTNLLASPQGGQHKFVWNAYQDLVVNGGLEASSNLVLLVTAVRPSTQVPTPGARTNVFAADERLIFTIWNRQAGVIDNVPPGQAQLVQPQGVAVLGNSVYFSDAVTGRVRVVALGTGQTTLDINTFFGGGGQIADGSNARDFALLSPLDLAAQNTGSGALFVCGSDEEGANGVVSKLYRVDGATPIVTTLAGGTATDITNSVSIYAVCYEPGAQTVYYAETTSAGTPHVEIHSIPPDGGADTTLAAGTGGTGDGLLASATLGTTGLAANWNIYPGLVFTTEQGTGRVRALNVTSGSAMFGAKTILANSVLTLAGPPTLSAPVGISIERQDALDVTDTTLESIFRIDESLNVTTILGDGIGGFNGDLPTPSANTRCLGPVRLAGDMKGPDAQHPSNGFYFSDTGNARIRLAEPLGAPITTFVQTFAGTTRDMGDLLPARIAQFDHPFSVLAVPNGLLVADTFVSRVRVIQGASTIVTTLAGNGNSGDTGDGGPGPLATVGTPLGLVADVNSQLYMSQLSEHVVRKLVTTPQGILVQPVAGVANVQGVPVSGQPASSQPLTFPRALAYAGGCVVVALADGKSVAAVHAINDTGAPATCAGVAVAPGAIELVAGGGTTAPSLVPTSALSCQLGAPVGLVADKAGDLYIADVTSNCVYRVTAAGQLTLLAGQPTQPASFFGDGGPATSAKLSACSGLALDEPNEQVLYILDSGNNVVRAVNVTGSSVTANGVSIAPGAIATVIGTPGAGGFGGDGGLALAAQLHLAPTGFGSNFTAIDVAGVVVLTIPDVGNDRIRLVLGTVIITYAGGGSLDGDATAIEPARSPENSGLTRPTSLVVAPDGTYYVCDLGRVRRASADNATQSRIAGTAQSFSGTDGPALDASFGYIQNAGSLQADVKTDPAGPRQLALGTINGTPVLAIADTLGNSVRLMNLATSGSVTPNGMSAISAGSVATIPFPPLAVPQGVAFTTSGLILVSDTGSGQIRAANIGAAGPVVCRGATLNPGNYSGTSIASITSPQNLALDPSGAILVVMNISGTQGPYAFSLLPAGTVTAYGQPIAANAAGIPIDAAASSVSPRGAAMDPLTGDFYFAARASARILKVAFADGSASAVAGNLTVGFAGDGGLATSAELRNPIAAGLDANGNIYILDAGNVRVRRCRNFP